MIAIRYFRSFLFVLALVTEVTHSYAQDVKNTRSTGASNPCTAIKSSDLNSTIIDAIIDLVMNCADDSTNTTKARSTTTSKRQTNSSTTADDACDAIESALPSGSVAYPIRDLITYQEELHETWSQGNADLAPACITFPTDANETSTIVKILNDSPGVPFAVKSGGHNPNKGWASTDGGVLIAMSKNAATVYNADDETADIGPGSRWEEVMSALEPDNRLVVGGRIGNVGVGGYMLGGGLSFLSSQHGLACDTVTNFEVVLADGTITDVNNSTNPDLFFALKGGGNQLGIITKYTMKTYPTTQIWGGTRIYFGDATESLIDAVSNFTTNFNDPKAAIIATTTRNSLLNLWVMFYFYDAPTPPAGVFDQFDAIDPVLDFVGTDTFATVLTNNNAFNIQGMRYLIRATTMPNPDTSTLYHEVYDNWSSYVDSVTDDQFGFIYNMAYQPLPAAISQASNAQGENVIGLDPALGDRMWMEFDISWGGLDKDGDQTAWSDADNITSIIDAHVAAEYTPASATKFAASTQDVSSNYTLFMNDAMFDQPIIERYPQTSQERLRAAKQKFDPDGFFTQRTGGFKI